jgi:hypothetical protein
MISNISLDIVATLIKKDGNNKADKQPDSAQKRDAVHSEVVSSIREGNLRYVCTTNSCNSRY